MNSNNSKRLGWPSAIAMLLGLRLVSSLWQQGRTVETVPYSVFEEYLGDGQLTEVQVGDRLITGTLDDVAGVDEAKGATVSGR